MNVPIWLEQRDGVFIASSVADPEVRAEGLTRAAALRDIRRRLLDDHQYTSRNAHLLASGELHCRSGGASGFG